MCVCVCVCVCINICVYITDIYKCVCLCVCRSDLEDTGRRGDMVRSPERIKCCDSLDTCVCVCVRVYTQTHTNSSLYSFVLPHPSICSSFFSLFTTGLYLSFDTVDVHSTLSIVSPQPRRYRRPAHTRGTQYCI